MPAPNVRFCIFTFGRDAEPTLILVRHLKFLGVAAKDVVVIDDGDNKFSDAERDAVVAEGAPYKLSAWKRGGNLNGKLAVQGVLSDLAAHSKDALRVIKVDADTLPSELLLQAVAAHSEFDILGVGVGKLTSPLMGACYAITPAAIERLQLAAAFLPAEGWYPEDVTIGTLALKEGLTIKTHPLGYQDYGTPGLHLKYVPSFAICFGFVTDTTGKPKRTKEVYANFVASKMRKYISLTTGEKLPGKLVHSPLPPTANV